VKVFVRLVFAAVCVLVMAAPAAAQIETQGGSQVRFDFSDDAAPAARQGDTTIEWRGQVGGLFWSSEAGFFFGAGLGMRPFNNKKIEIVGDLSFLRFNGHNGVYFSGNGLYHFDTNEPNFKPFAGGGLAILNAGGDTEARFQIAGGVEFNAAKRHPIRPELRIIFTEGDVATALLVSIGLGKS
jgi:hypothetical protein